MHPIECLTIIPPVLGDFIRVTGKPQTRTNSVQFLPLDDERWRVKTTHDFVTSIVRRVLGITKPIFVHHGRASTWYPINPGKSRDLFSEWLQMALFSRKKRQFTFFL